MFWYRNTIIVGGKITSHKWCCESHSIKWLLSNSLLSSALPVSSDSSSCLLSTSFMVESDGDSNTSSWKVDSSSCIRASWGQTHHKHTYSKKSPKSKCVCDLFVLLTLAKNDVSSSSGKSTTSSSIKLAGVKLRLWARLSVPSRSERPLKYT